MPKLAVKSRKVPVSDAETVTELTVDGFIDAENYPIFERNLEEASTDGGRTLLLDFGGVHYINSTGISALIRFFELYKDRAGVLCLANVARPVGLSMHLLGVTSFIPFLKDMAAGHEHIKEFLASSKAKDADAALASGASGGGTTGTGTMGAAERQGRKPFVHLRRRNVPGLERASVLVVSPSKSRFTRVLRLRFKTLNGDYHLMHDASTALARYREVAPDLIVVDERCDPEGEFVSHVKISEGRSLTSIIKLYPKLSDVARELDFKIWENDFLVEPFEVLELFSLTEAELCRLPRDRKQLVQQIRFEFKTRRENVEKAHKLSELIVRQAMVGGDEATAVYAAMKEGIDNAVVHGNRWDPERTVDINFLVDQNKISVIIEDNGDGFDYEYYLAQVNTDEGFERIKRRIVDKGVRGGLGILLMSKCSDRIEYSGGGNTLRLSKNRV